MGFEPTISAGERPQTYALDRAVTGTGAYHILQNYFFRLILCIHPVNEVNKWKLITKVHICPTYKSFKITLAFNHRSLGNPCGLPTKFCKYFSYFDVNILHTLKTVDEHKLRPALRPTQPICIDVGVLFLGLK